MPNQPYKPTFGSGVQQYQMDNVGKGARQRPPYAPGAANPGQQVNMALPNSAVIKSMMPQPQGFGQQQGPRAEYYAQQATPPVKVPIGPTGGPPPAAPPAAPSQGGPPAQPGQQSTNQWEQKASNLWGQQTAMDPNVWNKKAAEMRAQIGSDYANQRYQLAQQSAASGGGFSGQGLTKAGFLAQGEATAKAVATNQLALEQAKLGIQEKMQMLDAAAKFASLEDQRAIEAEKMKLQQEYLNLAQQGQTFDQKMAQLDLLRMLEEQGMKPGDLSGQYAKFPWDQQPGAPGAFESAKPVTDSAGNVWTQDPYTGEWTLALRAPPTAPYSGQPSGTYPWY